MSSVPPDMRPLWIHSEFRRGLAAIGLAAVPAVVASLLLRDDESALWVNILTVAMILWVFYGVAFSLLTWWAFHRATHAQLAVLVRHEHNAQGLAQYIRGGNGPESAVTLAVVAFLGATVLPRISAWTHGSATPVLTGLAIATVVVSWATLVVSYAVYYARLASQAGGFDFPGDDKPVFSDFVYFALMVNTTFGTTDVNVTSSRTRSAVTGHAILAFLFNTVTVAMVVGVLTSG